MRIVHHAPDALIVFSEIQAAVGSDIDVDEREWNGAACGILGAGFGTDERFHLRFPT